MDLKDLIFFKTYNLGAKGVWKAQAMALFDIFVVDTYAKSYPSHSLIACISFS